MVRSPIVVDSFPGSAWERNAARLCLDKYCSGTAVGYSRQSLDWQLNPRQSLGTSCLLAPRRRMLQRHPGAVLTAAGDALLDEIHAIDSVSDIWINRIGCRNRFASRALHDVVISAAIDVPKGLEKGFGMPSGEPAGGFARVIQVRCIGIASVQRVRLAVTANDHDVRFLLPPGDRALCAVNLDEQVVLAAVRNLTGRHGSQATVFETNHSMAVIVELSSRLEDFQIARDLGWNQPRHVTGQIVGVSGDVAEATGRSRFTWVSAPRSLLLSPRFEPRTEPALNVV